MAADVRALMAKEKQARRINHEFASYTKAGALTCVACQLNIKSEALWEGHLRSANHKTNVKRFHQTKERTVVKRKIEDVDETIQSGEAVDARKKLKPKPSSVPDASKEDSIDRPAADSEKEDEKHTGIEPPTSAKDAYQNTQSATESPLRTKTQRPEPVRSAVAEVDEDEWAAFERDVAPLAKPEYTAAIITAAPVSTSQLEAEAQQERKRLKDAEAEDEKEEGGWRMEEELEYMETLDQRYQKLKQQKDALDQLHQQRKAGTPSSDKIATEVVGTDPGPLLDSEDEIDDWYS